METNPAFEHSEGCNVVGLPNTLGHLCHGSGSGSGSVLLLPLTKYFIAEQTFQRFWPNVFGWDQDTPLRRLARHRPFDWTRLVLNDGRISPGGTTKVSCGSGWNTVKLKLLSSISLLWHLGRWMMACILFHSTSSLLRERTKVARLAEAVRHVGNLLAVFLEIRSICVKVSKCLSDM